MTIEQCADDFNPYGVRMPNSIPISFNLLFEKKTRLTTPSIVCYVQIDWDDVKRPFVKSIVKIYISHNPSLDIENDANIFDSFDDIFIHHNMESNNLQDNETLSEKQTLVFENNIIQVQQLLDNR